MARVNADAPERRKVMALRAIMLRTKIDKKTAEFEALRAKDAEFTKREAELEQAISEAQTDEEQEAVQAEVEKFEAEKAEHESAKTNLETEVSGLERELSEVEAAPPEEKPAERKNEVMSRRTKFFGMNIQERDAFLAREDVKSFLGSVRAAGLNNRAIQGADLTIPTIVLDLIRENVENYSKLVNRVRLRSVSGKARQIVMGAFPEGVWTEACAALNELTFAFSQTEVDGYKVGGIIYICKATLEDSDLDLASEIITALGVAIGTALDRSIIYGTGVKMPLGIVTRLAQEEEPDNYPATARAWKDLHTSNLITITGKTGIAIFQEIARATKAMKGKYSRGVKFWVMNESTYTDLLVEAMSINAAGAIVSGQGATMPVVGGDVIILSDDIIADGNIVAGYGDLYLLAERAGSAFERADQYKFAEDQIAFKGTARYDGVPVIAEAFIAIGIGAAPATDSTFIGDAANDTTLAGLTVGAVSLSPTFDPETLAYTATVTGASDVITANPSQAKAKVHIEFGGQNYPNGASLKWKTGANVVDIVVENGVSKRTYTVTATKSGG
jgi:HK97 family phage major capsid protein